MACCSHKYMYHIQPHQISRTYTRQNHDMSRPFLPHGGQNSFDSVDGAEEVGIELLPYESQCALRCCKFFDGADDSCSG